MLKGDFHDWAKYSEEMLVYCVQDVDITIQVFFKLTERMRKRGFSERSCRLEHEIRHVIDKQQQRGFFFDIGAANRLYDDLRGREAALAVPIRELFPRTLEVAGTYTYRVRADGQPYASYHRHLERYPQVVMADSGQSYDVFDWQEFNIGSPKQRIDKLLSIGFRPSKFTKKGNPQVDEETLLEFAKTANTPEVTMIAEWLVLNGRANMINTWLNNVDPTDSRMHGFVLSCGAASRRMTHSGPNTANIPSNEAKYGKECRTLWTVQDSERDTLVGYDAKAAQMRCFAHFLPDPNSGRKYWDTEFCKDPHQLNADLIGIERRPVKNVFYANMFGAYPPKLAATAGFQGSKKEAEAYGTWIREQLYETTPGLRELTEQAKDEFKSNGGFMECIDGGYVRCPAENAALNYKIQPAEAVLMKTAAVMIDKRAMERGIEHYKVCDVHDEGQHECPRGSAQAFGELCVESLRDAGEELGFRVPTAGDFKIGENWSLTH
jgi:DNA polymerase-1